MNIPDKNLGRTTQQKLAGVVGQLKGLINPILESHTSNVGLKSHTLQLDPNNDLFAILLLLMPFACSAVLLKQSISQRICQTEKWFQLQISNCLYRFLGLNIILIFDCCHVPFLLPRMCTLPFSLGSCGSIDQNGQTTIWMLTQLLLLKLALAAFQDLVLETMEVKLYSPQHTQLSMRR